MFEEVYRVNIVDIYMLGCKTIFSSKTISDFGGNLLHANLPNSLISHKECQRIKIKLAPKLPIL